MMRLTLEIAGETLFGADVGDASTLVAEGLELFLNDYHQRIHSLFSLPEWVPTPTHRRLRRSRRDLDRLVLGIIEARRGQEGGENDLLDLLMTARDGETGEGMTDVQLRDEVMTILLGGHHVPAGSIVMLSTWVTHRHPALWDEPERFRPERFDPEAPEKRHRFAYFPFGGGERVCIGSGFALLETRLVLATLAQRFELHLEPGQKVGLEPTVTLRPRVETSPARRRGTRVAREARSGKAAHGVRPDRLWADPAPIKRRSTRVLHS